MPFAAIFVPDFPAEAVARAEPELREQAVAVLDSAPAATKAAVAGAPNGRPLLLKVMAANERARRARISLGMTKLQAEDRFSGRDSGTGLAIRRRSPAQEASAHAALLDVAYGFSPRVEANPAAPDTMVLDISGLERLFGPPARMARELARRISDVGLEVHVATADNVETAVLAARGFAGVAVIPAGQEAERLGPLGVELLGCGPELLDTLDRWGVRTLRALAALPETAVGERLGEAGVRLQKLARGAGSRPLVPSDPPLVFEEIVELEYPLTLLEPLSFLLNRMVEQLCARLSARALSTNELRLRLGLSAYPDAATQVVAGSHPQSPAPAKEARTEHPGSRNEHELVLRLPVPMLDVKTFLRLLQLELRTNSPARPVEKIMLRAEPVPPRFTQDGLFVPAAPEPEKLELLLARIRNVVGGPKTDGPSRGSANAKERESVENSPAEPRVGSPELLDTHRPDAFRMKAFVPPTHGNKEVLTAAPDQPAWDPGHALHLPGSQPALRRFRPPRPVQVELRGQQPARIVSNARAGITGTADTDQKLDGTCIAVAGPWRESGDWWTDAPWSREVWDVVISLRQTPPGASANDAFTLAGAKPRRWFGAPSKNPAGNAWVRLYRDLRHGAWFLEGIYD